ncbi:MAG: EamA family transporter [Rikenellaceae bacterium]
MSPRQSNISLIVANILFGVSYTIIVDLLNEKIRYDQLFTLLILVGAVVFVPLALTKLKGIKESMKDAPKLILYSVITIYGWSYLTLMGSTHTTAVNIAAISTLGPTVTIVAAAMQKTRDQRIKHIQPNFVRALATPFLLLCIVTTIIIGDIQPTTTTNQIIGTILITAGVISMGISTVVAKSLHRQYGTLVLLGWYFAIGTLLLPFAVPNWLEGLRELLHTQLDWESKFELVLLPILDMVVPMYLLYRGSRNLTPLHTALYRYIQPIIAFIILIMNNFTQLHTLLPALGNLASTLMLTLILLLMATFIMPRDEVK